MPYVESSIESRAFYDGGKYRQGRDKVREAAKLVDELPINETQRQEAREVIRQTLLLVIDRTEKLASLNVDEQTRSHLLTLFEVAVSGTLESSTAIQNAVANETTAAQFDNLGICGPQSDHETDKKGLAELPDFFQE